MIFERKRCQMEINTTGYKEITVGLIVLTNPYHIEGTAAVLQVRGELDHEILGWRDWPGGCEVTCRGTFSTGEEYADTLKRVVAQKLGQNAYRMMVSYGMDERNMLEVGREDEGEGKFLRVTFGVFVRDPRFIKHLQLNASTGGIRWLPREQLKALIDLTTIDKVRGVTERRTIAMSPNEIEAVRKAFELLAPDAGAEAP